MTKKMLPVYKGLYDKLGNEPLFLYNYAAELNVAGRMGRACVYVRQARYGCPITTPGFFKQTTANS